MKNYRLLLIWAVLLLAMASQLLMPIKMGDTDMWYHIADGNYILENRTIPNDLYHSYYDDDDYYWYDHFWGFQVLVAEVYDAYDYQGLLLLRSFLVTLSILSIGLMVFQRDLNKDFWLKFFIFSALAIMILDKGFQLRPHLVVYILIPLLIFILNSARKYIWIIPLIFLLWLNMHSVSYVIALLIWGAFIIQDFIANKYRTEKKQIILGMFIAATFFITPDPLQLLLEPWKIDVSGLNQFINEMKPVSMAVFYKLNVDLLNVNTALVVPLFGFLIVVSVLSIRKANINVAYILMTLGGCYLLSRGVRFYWEWVLLSSPLIINNLDKIKVFNSKKHLTTIPILTIFVLYTFVNRVELYEEYPLKISGLAPGVVAYIQNNKLEGRLLATPNLGGYFHKELYPKVKIHSDMKLHVTYPEYFNALRSDESLLKLIKKYDVDFVLSKEKSRITFFEKNDFDLVYLGDEGFLWADRETIRNNGLKKITFDYNEKIGKIEAGEFLESIDELIDIYPSEKALRIGIIRFINTDDFALSERYINLYLNKYPDSNLGEYYMGIYLTRLDKCEEAIPYFEEAVDKAENNKDDLSLRAIATCYFNLQDFTKSYEIYNESLNYLAAHQPYEHIYRYAFSSIVVGEIKKAKQLLQIILQNENIDVDEGVLKNTKELVQKIDNGAFEVPNIFKWTWLKITGELE